MIGHAHSGPLHPQLQPYIDGYIHFRHQLGVGQLYKHVLPCPNIAVILNEAPMCINGKPVSDTVVIGIHENLHRMEAGSEQVNSFVIRFTPFGFSRFISIPVSRLTEKIVDAQEVLGKGIQSLFEAVRKENNFEARVRRVENYLLSRLKVPDKIDLSVFQIAAYLQKDPQAFSFDAIKERFPFDLSSRQMARRFKSTIGVNLQTYVRICRFELAKKMFFDRQEESLTQIGLLSGYYDQAHFAKEFKKLSGMKAGKFFPACSLQRILHEGTPLQQAI